MKHEDATGKQIWVTPKFSAFNMATVGSGTEEHLVEVITKDIQEICIDDEEIRRMECGNTYQT